MNEGEKRSEILGSNKNGRENKFFFFKQKTAYEM